ncbi:hypothetical protein RND71_044080 [Anisodus tanguticus]|uniref:Uncharacterized protein n=1 Tax=Anisodus tanguticus TaxID=243964 RepID=A0AAE1UMT9_9SOLA|nr:hypothetical protein RND71_044080 [Anisodus tanguticus]
MGELYRKPQILLKKTFQKTKNLFLKTLHNLNSFLFRSHHKLPKVCHFNPFFSRSNRIPNSIIQELGDFYRDFPQQWDYCDHNEVPERKSIGEISVNTMNDQERKSKEEKMGEAFLQNTSKGDMLAQKMKELEIMDEEDLDQMLDIKEVLYYYSHLTCPVYVDIVDRYFMDMYDEFSLPQTFINVNSSMRSLGPTKL